MGSPRFSSEENSPLPCAERKNSIHQRRKSFSTAKRVVGTPGNPQKKKNSSKIFFSFTDYLAPEILLGTEHGFPVDWWAVGVVLFEMLTGIPPFNDETPEQIFQNILQRNIPWPEVPGEMSREAQDLVDRLLTMQTGARLGSRGTAEIKQHAFFRDVNWEELRERRNATPHFVPQTRDIMDTSHFHIMFVVGFFLLC